MIATTTNCLNVSQMQALVDGRLSPDESDTLIEHVDGCDTCRQRIEGLDPASDSDSEHTTSASAAWSLSAEPSVAVDSVCEMAIGNLIRQSPPVNRAGPPEESLELGPYKLLGTLGQGGMAAVCLAKHQRLNRKCAIKFLPRHRASNADWLRRFDREMVTVAALEHPHIVRATDAGHENGWHFLVMEYLDGMDVGRVATALGRLPIADACAIVHQAASGLAHVHRHDLIHRDIKPSNLMLCQDGTVKLLDLGLVLAGDDPLGSDDRLTTVGHLMGTMPYMPPEQLLDSRSVSQAADVYALGATLYRLLCGRTPHPAQHGLASQVLAITQHSPPPVDRLREDCPRELATLVADMLHHDGPGRPTAAEVAERLKPWAADAKLKRLVRHAQQREPSSENSEPPSWMPTPSRAVAAPPQRPRWQRWMLAGGLPLLVLLAGFVIKLQTQRGEVVITSDDADATVSVGPEETTVELSQDTPGPLGAASDPADASATDGRVYQGHPLNYWLDLLKREQDADRIADAMNAVEILSRGTDQRVAAAKATLMKARDLGGFVIGGRVPDFGSGNQNASHLFMGNFIGTFPRYMPDPGLPLLVHELHEGNHNSRLATLFLLNTVTGRLGWERPSSTTRHEEDQESQQEVPPVDKELLQRLLTGLEKMVQSLQDRPQDEVSSSAVENAVSLALQLASSHLSPDQTPKWIAAPIAKRLEKYQKRYRRADGTLTVPQGGQGMSNGVLRPVWLPSYDFLAFALAHRSEDRFQLDADFTIASATHPAIFQRDRSMNDLLEMVAEAYPDHDLQLAEQLLGQITAMSFAGPSSGFGSQAFYGPASSNASHSVLAPHVDHWQQAVERIVAIPELTDRALPALVTWKEKLQQLEGGAPQELLETINQAITTLQKRWNEEHAGDREGGAATTGGMF